jgi:hypothetical protein
MFGFHSPWLPNYEIHIEHWRWIIKQQSAPQLATPALERELLAKLWELPDLTLPRTSKRGCHQWPSPSTPDFNCQFYLKTNWSKNGMVVVLCQADPDSSESVAAEKTEDAGGPCLQSQNRTGLDPHPFYGPSLYSWQSQLPLL